MSDLERRFITYLSEHPEIELCAAQQIVNRRALTRLLVRESVFSPSEREAGVAMLRRYPFAPQKHKPAVQYAEIRIATKDSILIVDLPKTKDVLGKLQSVVASTRYEEHETLKIVVGAAIIKVILDKQREKELMSALNIKPLAKKDVSELSAVFPDETREVYGVLSFITKQFTLHEIPIVELLTASPELLIYVEGEHVLSAYNVLRQIQEGSRSK